MAKNLVTRSKVHITTVLGPETHLKGTLKFDSDLMIRGIFEGDIQSRGSLYIDTEAQVTANKISAVNIIVAGIIHGNLEALDRVELHENAKVYGNIKATRLRISDNVVFQGHCEMITDAESFDPFANYSGIVK